MVSNDVPSYPVESRKYRREYISISIQYSTYVVFIIRTVLSSWPSPSVSDRLICNSNSWQWQLWLWWRDIVSHDCWPPHTTLGLIHFTALTVPISYSIRMTPRVLLFIYGLCLLVFISNSIYLSFKNIIGLTVSFTLCKVSIFTRLFSPLVTALNN